MRHQGNLAGWIAVAVLACVAPARAMADAPKPPHALAFEPARDWTILGAGLVLRLGLALGYGTRNVGCRWCEYEGDTDTRNGLDRAGRGLRWQHPGRAATLSDVTLVGTQALAGTALVWLGQRAGATWQASLQDVVIMGQAVAVSGLITQAAKVSVRRQRPYAHARGPDTPDADADDSQSFFSGHTSSAFAFATSAATVATLRGYDAAPWMWTGVALAGATGYLRVAADKHYVTDVLVGAAVGTAAGVGLTYWLHGRVDDPSTASPAALTVTVDGGLANDAAMFGLASAF